MDTVFGVSGILLSIYGCITKSDVKFRILLGMACICLGIQLGLSLHFVGTIGYVITGLRLFSSIFLGKSLIAFLVFSLTQLGLSYYAFSSPIDILLMFSGVIGCYGAFFLSQEKLRMANVVVGVLQIAFNLLSNNLEGVIMESIVIISCLIGAYNIRRFHAAENKLNDIKLG